MSANSKQASDCARCVLGPFTIYGPTFRTAPNDMALRRLAIQHVEARRTILAEGEIPEKIFTLRSGWAFRCKEMPGGRRTIISFLVPGDSILLESLIFPRFPLPYSVKSATPVILCSFSADDMRQVTNAYPEQKREAEEAAIRYHLALNRRIADLGRRKAEGRIAQLFLELETRLERRHLVKDHAFEFPLRQEHIADATGLTGAHVNRTLSNMRKKNLIDLKPQRLQILDRAGLARLAEDG